MIANGWEISSQSQSQNQGHDQGKKIKVQVQVQVKTPPAPHPDPYQKPIPHTSTDYAPLIGASAKKVCPSSYITKRTGPLSRVGTGELAGPVLRHGWRKRSLHGRTCGVSRQPTRADPARSTEVPQWQLQLHLHLQRLSPLKKPRASANTHTLTPWPGTQPPHTAAPPPTLRRQSASAASRPNRGPRTSPAKYRPRSPAPANPTRPPSRSDR